LAIQGTDVHIYNPEMNLKSEKEKTFLDFFEKHNNDLSNYCRALCIRLEDAEDLMSETIVIAYSNFDKIKDPQKLKYYLFGIASRLFKKHLRRKKIVQFLPVFNANHISSKESSEDQAALKILYRSIRKLKSKSAEILVLKEISGFTTKEIAELMQMNENSVKTKLSRAKQKLAEILRPEFDRDVLTNYPNSENQSHELKNGITLKTFML
jgi:RNA polymerase sigma-70 factor, ECF subfamily